jgi:hypothetical protein
MWMWRAGLLLLLGAIVMGRAGDTAAESLRGQLDGYEIFK